MTSVEYPLWIWLTFFAVVLVALFVDIGIVNRSAHVPTRRETFAWSIVWVSLALLFNVFLYWQVGTIFNDWDLAFKQSTLFITGYLIELSLSVDNLFVFLLIFSFFKVPKKYQHRVLFWGIMGALVMRMIMIFAGAELVERFHWIIYVFGAFLVYTGIKMFGNSDDNFEPHESAIVKLATKYIRISKHYDGDKFFVVKDGVRTGTLLLLVLITVEFTDLVFAVDSIPAIFGITTDRFIVYTSNIFAILGLRTFFFLLADLADRFHLLKYGLAFVLTFIGVKMLLPLGAQGLIMLLGSENSSGFADIVRRYVNHEFEQIVINISLGVVVGAIFISIILSLMFPPKHKPVEGDEPPA
ncbi:MAG: TerC family protein [Pyrinomonadaceae bacterium]|nr:TerC family protein [Acidobacteriota bacterium]MBP7474087.1 TerC family protein [Pyrinomonadaceae bacterium]MBP9108450.1 TerC family protein [Pyrinomonadaceae bacterium]